MKRMPGPKPIAVRPLSQGASQKEIILDQVLYWIRLQATAEEIAGSFGVSVDTLDRRLKDHCGMGFAELYKKHSAEGKISLRRFQFKLAEKNSTMAIWLGKQWLGQKDHEEICVSPAPNQELINLQIENAGKNVQIVHLQERVKELNEKLSASGVT